MVVTSNFIPTFFKSLVKDLLLSTRLLLWWAGITQLLQGFAEGWTVQESNPGGARFSVPVQTGTWDHPASCKTGTGSFSREKIGRGFALVTHLPSLAEVLLPLWTIMVGSSANYMLFLSCPANDSTAPYVPNLRRLLHVECSRPISILINVTMNVQLGRWHCWKTGSWGCLRTWYWEEYLDLGGTR